MDEDDKILEQPSSSPLDGQGAPLGAPKREAARRILSTQQAEQSAQTTAETSQNADLEALAQVPSSRPLHSVFGQKQKVFIICMAGLGSFFSPLRANIYFPALPALAKDLNVSNELINLTLTSYMIFQGLAPAFMGDLADVAGRRPVYIICFVIYLC